MFCIVDALTAANAHIAALETELNASREAWEGVIRLKRIYNFLCSMLVLTPFA
jgi:hypothetical protein